MSASWERNYRLLVEYVEKNRCLPTRSYNAKDDMALCHWMNRQRANREKLTAQQQTKLQSIAGWRWQSFLSEWRRQYKLIRACAAIDECILAQSHEAPDACIGIAGWQRRVLSSYADEWRHKCDLVRAYAATNKRLPKQKYKTADGVALGQWISTQRRNRAKLTAEQQASLESIEGWQWQALKKQKPALTDRAKEWQRKCDLVRAYVAANEQLPVISHKADDGTALGMWISNQRKNHAKLTAAQRASLESIAGWQWRVRKRQKPVLADRAKEWQRKCDLVRAYVVANGCLPPSNHTTDDRTALGVWIQTQRSRRAKLTAEQRASLESIDGWLWRVREPTPSDEDAEWARECAQLRECSAAKRRKRAE